MRSFALPIALLLILGCMGGDPEPKARRGITAPEKALDLDPPTSYVAFSRTTGRSKDGNSINDCVMGIRSGYFSWLNYSHDIQKPTGGMESNRVTLYSNGTMDCTCMTESSWGYNNANCASCDTQYCKKNMFPDKDELKERAEMLQVNSTSDDCYIRKDLGGDAKRMCFFEGQLVAYEIEGLSFTYLWLRHDLLEKLCLTETASIDYVGKYCASAYSSVSDPSICERMQANSGKCLIQMAKREGDPGLCRKVTDLQERGYCMYLVALANGDAGLCKEAGATMSQDECVSKVAKARSDPALCEWMSTDRLMMLCRQEIEMGRKAF